MPSSRQEGHGVPPPSRTARRRSFQAQQDANRRKIRILLVAFFAVAVLAGWFAGAGLERFRAPDFLDDPDLRRPPYEDYRYLMAGTALLLGFVHMRRLRRRPHLVALGFAPSRALQERRFHNVAEEMAIAAGLPVPRLWLVEDPSLNAFAFGWEPRNTLIVLTSGLLERLDRDELQAVIGHEMAHIRNGDTKLMTLLVGMTRAVYVFAPFALGPLGAMWTAASEGALEDDADEEPPPPQAAIWSRKLSLKEGLLLVAATPLVALTVLVASLVVSLTLVLLFGALFLLMPLLALAWAVWELVRGDPDPQTDGEERRSWGWILFVTPMGLVLGPAILVVGLIAPLAVLLLRLAIARNQEFEADAGAVELTRNPGALLAALETLLTAGEDSRQLPKSLAPLCIAPPRRERASGAPWRTLFSTHPSLEERMRRIESML